MLCLSVCPLAANEILTCISQHPSGSPAGRQSSGWPICLPTNCFHFSSPPPGEAHCARAALVCASASSSRPCCRWRPRAAAPATTTMGAAGRVTPIKSHRVQRGRPESRTVGLAGCLFVVGRGVVLAPAAKQIEMDSGGRQESSERARPSSILPCWPLWGATPKMGPQKVTHATKRTNWRPLEVGRKLGQFEPGCYYFCAISLSDIGEHRRRGAHFFRPPRLLLAPL